MKNINYIALAIKKYIPRFIWTKLLSPIGRLIIAPYQFFWCTGWLKSMWKGYACNLKGEHMPWLSMPAVEYLESLDLKGRTILELGGGSSTIYFARRGAVVHCLEQNVNWRVWIRYQLSKLRVIDYDVIIYPTMEELTKVLTGITFDMILLYENPHDELLSQLVAAHISSRCVLIDNTEVPWQERGTDYITKYFEGMQRVDFTGFALGNCIQQTSSLYITTGLNFISPTKSTQARVHLTNQQFKYEV